MRVVEDRSEVPKVPAAAGRAVQRVPTSGNDEARSEARERAMTVQWLIEKSVVENEERSIAEAIRSQGFDCKTIDFASYMDDSSFLDLFDADACIVCCGSH